MSYVIGTNAKYSKTSFSIRLFEHLLSFASDLNANVRRLNEYFILSRALHTETIVRRMNAIFHVIFLNV